MAIRKELHVKDNFLTIELPDEFKEHEVEVTIRLKRDIEQEILADQIRIDTKKWRFRREEIYAR